VGEGSEGFGSRRKHLQEVLQRRHGEFCNSSYQFATCLNECDGVVEMLWRGKDDVHFTKPGYCSKQFARVGSAVQINAKLVKQVVRVHNMESGTSHVMDHVKIWAKCNRRITKKSGVRKQRKMNGSH